MSARRRAAGRDPGAPVRILDCPPESALGLFLRSARLDNFAGTQIWIFLAECGLGYFLDCVLARTLGLFPRHDGADKTPTSGWVIPRDCQRGCFTGVLSGVFDGDCGGLKRGLYWECFLAPIWIYWSRCLVSPCWRVDSGKIGQKPRDLPSQNDRM